MKQLLLTEHSDIPVCVALGYFDCIHVGHRALLSCACESAGESLPAFFTFDNPPFDVLGVRTSSIYNYSTRLALAASCGIEAVIHAPFDDALKKSSPQEFLNLLFRAADIRGIVCGQDYTFGIGGSGDVNFLRNYAALRGVNITAIENVVGADGQKVSSTRIRHCIENGEIADANALLGAPYRLTGTVLHGRGEGHEYRTPTANLVLNNLLLAPREGVYSTRIELDGQVYRAVTNVGKKPTFGDETPTVESYILDYSGDLYGREITVEFFKRLRSVRKFDSKSELYEQIQRDIEESRQN